VGLPPRLMAVLEGESLVNDASALVVLRTAIAALGVGSEFSLGHTALEFLWAVAGAILIGLLVGWATALLRQRLDDPVLNTTISFAVPFLAYFPAEEVHSSGVLAVVVAGVVTGTLGSRRFSARDRQNQATTWTTISFILESAVFLAMGYELPQFVDDARAETNTGEITGLVVVVVTLLIGIRFLGLAWPALSNRFGANDQGEQTRARLTEFEEHLDAMEPSDEREENRLAWARHRLARGRADVAFEEREPLTARGYLVLAWAGMRGVVTVAAAQTIPVGTPHRATVILAAFFVALITLVLFGLTLPLLIARMRFTPDSDQDRHDAVQALLRRVGESAIDTLGPLDEQTIDGQPLDPGLIRTMEKGVLPRLLAATRDVREGAPVPRDQLDIVQRRYLDAMRDALISERAIGAYSSEAFRQVEGMLDSLEYRLRPA
jgi:monovalent cation/hydrogen antiporter